MRPPKRTSIVARTRATLQPRATRADAAVKRAAAEADAKRAYPTTPTGVALKNKSSERCRENRDASARAKKTAFLMADSHSKRACFPYPIEALLPLMSSIR